MELTDTEAEYLLKIEKHCEEDKTFEYPFQGGKITIPLVSVDKREEFLLDINRMRVNLTKNTFQNRARKSIILARLDLGCPPHRNPDGKEISAPHIHIYKEGFGDKIAYELPDVFKDCKSIPDYLNCFLDYCNITKKPNIEMGLFV